MENEYDIVTEDEMEEVIQSFMDSSSNDTDLSYKDKFVTEEQKQRDIEVTKLLQAYVKTYEKKVEISEKYQKLILYPCMAIICIFAIVLLIFSCYIVSKKTGLKINDKYPYGKPQTDEVARGSGNREYGRRRLREKLPNFSGVSFFRAGNSSNRVNAFHICVYVHPCAVLRYIASQHP